MNDSVCLALVVVFILLILFNSSKREHWQGEYNPVGRGRRGGWDNRSYRSSIQPISYSGWGVYGHGPGGHSGPYRSYGGIHRYVPSFESSFESDDDIISCINACSSKNGEEYQECLRLCRNVYPSFSVV